MNQISGRAPVAPQSKIFIYIRIRRIEYPIEFRILWIKIVGVSLLGCAQRVG